MRSLRLLPVLLALLSTACATPTSVGPALAPPPPAALERAFLWEVTRPETPQRPLYLTGSVHMGRPGQFVLPPSMEAALARSQSLVVELDPDRAPERSLEWTARLGLLSPPDGLSARLSAETRALLPAALQRAGLAPAIAEHMRPWLVLFTLQGMELVKAGYSDTEGLDQLLLARARGRMGIVELETVQGQFRVLADLPDPLQDLLLREYLEDSSGIEQGLERIFAAWQEGDPDALVPLVFENREDPAYAPFYEALFFQRNRQMADKLVALLDSPQTHFAVVGAGHLVGEEGLLELLTRRGLQVRQLPRAP